MPLRLLFLLVFIVSSTKNVVAQQTWQSLNTILTNTNNTRFDDIFFLNENIGWAANGYNAAVYKTVDGGQTWVNQLDESDITGDYYFRNIEFLDENIGFIGTLNNTLFKTTDGGNTWSSVTITPNPPAICGLSAVNTNTIYGCGAYFSPAFVIKSTDSGTTWEYIDMSAYANALVEVLFIDELTGFASGRSNTGGVILKTTDGGVTWTTLYNTGIAGEYVWKLQLLENENMIIGSVQSVNPNPGKLLKSLDNGNTWQSFNAPETNIQAVGFIDANTGWMGGHSTGFYETNDGGQTWTNLNIGGNLNRILILNNSLAYASGATIYKFTDNTLDTENITKARESLHIQLKENPVDERLQFLIDFPKSDHIFIEIYSAEGKFIQQLSSEFIHQPQQKNYSFDVSHLASGNYLLNFHNNTGRQALSFIKH